MWAVWETINHAALDSRQKQTIVDQCSRLFTIVAGEVDVVGRRKWQGRRARRRRRAPTEQDPTEAIAKTKSALSTLNLQNRLLRVIYDVGNVCQCQCLIRTLEFSPDFLSLFFFFVCVRKISAKLDL